MSYGEQGQESRSQQGLLQSSSGTTEGQVRNVVANILAGVGRNTDEGAAMGKGGLLSNLFDRPNAPITYRAPGLTASGLLPEQQNAFSEAVSQALGRHSTNFTRRGFNRPENIQAIAGSAARDVAPSFAPMIAQNVALRTQEPLVHEDIMRKRFDDILRSLGITSGLAGGSSMSQGSGWNAGWGGSLSAGNSSTTTNSTTSNGNG